MARVSSTAGRRIVLQIATVLLVAVVADYLSDRTFPHHWIVYVVTAGLGLILIVMYLTLGPDT